MSHLNRSHSKLRFVISLLAFTAMAFLLASCWNGGGPKTNTNTNTNTNAPTEGPSPSGGKAAGLSLNYQNKFNMNQDTVGEDITVVFGGSRKLGPGEVEKAGDNFKEEVKGNSKSVISKFVTFLNEGNWDVWIAFPPGNQQTHCPFSIEVKSQPSNAVTFVWNESNSFDKCETTY
jgi:hypothetical protein